MLLRLFRSSPATEPRSLQDALVPAKGVSCIRHGDRTVLLDFQSGQYYGLDEVGTRVWDLLQSGTSAHQVAEQLEREYAAPRAVLEADVRALLMELHSAGLVKPC